MQPQIRETATAVALGIAGGLAGLACMDRLMRSTSRWVAEDGRPAKDVSLIGRHHREGESSTAALGRHAHRALVGREPDDERAERLSNGIHRAFGVSMAAVYGAARADRRRPYCDVAAGAAFGLGLWALADEGVIPLLGLKDGFSSYPPSQHLQALGGHVAFGVVTAASSQLLRRAIESA